MDNSPVPSIVPELAKPPGAGTNTSIGAFSVSTLPAPSVRPPHTVANVDVTRAFADNTTLAKVAAQPLLGIMLLFVFSHCFLTKKDEVT